MEQPGSLNVTCSSSTMPACDSEPEAAAGSLTQKVADVTDSEMKNIEVQKMEGELTIRMLEREYHEAKKNFVYSQKKLAEARKKAANQAESINQLVRANTAIVEKFNELKNYQNEIILANISNAEKSSDNCNNKNVELTNTFKVILDQENYSESLKEDIRVKKSVVNKDIQKEIEDKKLVTTNYNGILAESKKTNEKIKALFNQEMSDRNNVEALVEGHTKRVIQLETDAEVLQKEYKLEIENLKQEKNKFAEFFKTNMEILEGNKALISTLKSELLSIEKSSDEKKEFLKTLESNKDELLKEVEKKRQILESSKKMLDENIEKINDDQAKVKNELEIRKASFSKKEEDMQKELSHLHTSIEDKKKLVKQLEKQQEELTKLREIKSLKQKELSHIDRELQNKAKESANELRKYEQILSDKNKAQNELDSKVKKLQEEKNSIKLKLESLDKDKADKAENNSIQSTKSGDINKINKADDINKKDSNVNFKKLPETSESPAAAKLITSFGFDSSDESEDEIRLKNAIFKKPMELKKYTLKASEYDYDSDNEAIKQNENNISTSEKLFNELLSQKYSNAGTYTGSQKISKEEDVFKVPQPYATPTKKKYTTKYGKK